MWDTCLFDFKLSDKVLLLGEGNFSFSCCLLKLIQKKCGAVRFSNIYTTCYQTELSHTASENVDFLRSIGAVVLLGIDATKLNISQQIASLKFNKIIFNFPHVGGKMKIHLNRELLRQFFISASGMIEHKGQVVVTLCSGQGGTGFDLVTRRWDDTWQIVEQAAHGSFVLFKTHFFPHEAFKEYHPVGYRGREQKFTTKSAIVYGFRFESLPIKYLNDSVLQEIQAFHPVDDTGELLVSSAHKLTIENISIFKENSPYCYIIGILENNLKKYSNNYLNVSDKICYNTEFSSEQPLCLFQNKPASLRSSLLQVVSERIDKDVFASGLVFPKLSSDFTRKGTHIHSIIKCALFRDVIRSFISSLDFIFNMGGTFSDETKDDCWFFTFETETAGKNNVCWGDLNSEHVTIDLDLICSYAFNVSLQELRSRKLKFDFHEKKMILPCLYPVDFTFDVSFASKDDLNFDQFYNVLYQISDNIIESANLLSIYENTDTKEKYYCFRLIYRSYDKPLYRKLVVEIHQNVIGKTLENILNVRVH